MSKIALLFLLVSGFSHAEEIFNQTFDCENGKTISIALDVETHLPATSEIMNSCYREENGSDYCQDHLPVKNALTVRWTVKSNLLGLGNVTKTHQMNISVVPTAYGNPVQFNNNLGFELEDFWIHANFSYRTLAAITRLSETSFSIDGLKNFSVDSVSFNTFRTNDNGETSVVCNGQSF